METSGIKKLLELVAEGEIKVEEAVERLKVLPYEDLDFAKVDHHRSLRRGFPEVIFCQGKTADQIVGIAEKILESNGSILATRCTPTLFDQISPRFPEAVYHEAGNLFAAGIKDGDNPGRVAVVSAGTSDRPVAEEAALTAHYLGCEAKRIYDVGVAGLHRLLANWKNINSADVIVVVAGMEGALASVVAGIADAPVIAVPTSVGYGASFGGLSALLTMLNSCAGGVTVVNIDNGFGGAFAAAIICRAIFHKSRGEGSD